MAAPPKKTGRTPTREELLLWKQATRDARRLPAVLPLDIPAAPERPEPLPPPMRLPQDWQPAAPAAVLLPLRCGVYDGVDGNTAARVRRGEYPINARLDLHGLSREQAYDALRAGLEAAHAQGKRCMLIITGKGSLSRLRGEASGGVLRGELPRWLNDGALRPYVLAYGEAAPRHGGAGAFYLLIKRKRVGA